MIFFIFNKPTLLVIDRFGQCYGKTFYRLYIYTNCNKLLVFMLKMQILNVLMTLNGNHRLFKFSMEIVIAFIQ